MELELGTLSITFHPSWINNRVKEMGATSWYVDMHHKAYDYNKNNLFEKYGVFVKSCSEARLYSYRMSDLSGWL